MKQFLLVLLAVAILQATSVSANETPASLVVHINGLVCDFCAQALEKVFSSRDEVDHIEVDMDESVTRIWFNEGKTLDDATLTTLITDAGYNVESIER